MYKFIYFIVLSFLFSSCGGGGGSTQTLSTDTAQENSDVCTLSQAETLLLEEGYEIDLPLEATGSTELVTKIEEECSVIVARKLIVELNGFSIRPTIPTPPTVTPSTVSSDSSEAVCTLSEAERLLLEEGYEIDLTQEPTGSSGLVTKIEEECSLINARKLIVDINGFAIQPTALLSTATPPSTETPTPISTEVPMKSTEVIIEEAEMQGYSLLKATGQITPNIAGYKDDGYYQIGIAQNNDKNEDIYEVLSNNMVYDRITGLTWYNSDQIGTLADAMQICDNRGYSGEWRVPTIKELMTLMMYQYTSPTAHPTIYNSLFKYFDVDNQERINFSIDIVSQDDLANLGYYNYLYFARFGIGSIEIFSSNDRESIFCVSGDSSYTLPHYEQGKNYLLNTTHYLMWQDQLINSTSKMSWFEAIEYCEGLELAGYVDWRLPNINEVVSIYDNTKNNFTIDNFNYAPTGLGLWSSTYYPNNTEYVYAGMLNFGIIKYLPQTEETYVRCVRSNIDPNQEKIISTSTRAPEQDTELLPW